MIRLTANIFLKFVIVIFFLTPLYPQITGDVRIGIVHPELTKQFLYKSDNNFYPIQDWELFFLSRKINYQVFEDSDLDNYSFTDTDVLILPSVEILSNDGIESIKTFLAEGKSILVLGALGTLDESGRKRKPDALNLLTDIDVQELPIEDNIAYYQKIYADNFIGLSLGGSPEIQILNQLAPFYAKVIPSGAKILGEYFIPENEETNETCFPGIVLHKRKNSSKVLWLAFQMSQVSVHINRKSILDKIFLNSLSVLADEPVVWVNLYPSNYSFASLLECNLDKISEFDPQIRTTLKDLNVRANFFITPAQIIDSFDQLNSLAAVGDLNLLFDGFQYLDKDQHTVDSIFEQTYKFLSGESRQTGGFGIKFLNTYNEVKYLNDKTKKYFDFYLTEDHSYKINNDSEYREDISSVYPEKRIIINLSELMDQNYSIRSSLQEDLDLAKMSGGIITMTFEDNTVEKFNGNNKVNLVKILNIIKENNCWLTTYSELFGWYEKRKNLKAELTNNDDELLLTIQVSNLGDTLVENVGLVVSIPAYYKNLILKSYNYKFNLNKDTGLYSIIIPFIREGEKVLIDFEYERR